LRPGSNRVAHIQGPSRSADAALGDLAAVENVLVRQWGMGGMDVGMALIDLWAEKLVALG
jgi:hypothetical protein